ncbi:MAG: ketosynthase chain-length factor [Actinobacteria bacterium]|nr:ketosynthase chain-length factor [Actinomycetota bacterium]
MITGLGVVAPNGIGTENWWEATKAGTSGIGRITQFDPSQYPVQLAGEVDGFEASDYVDQRVIVQTDRWTHMALAATQMALDDAGFDPADGDPYRMSVITASGSGGNEFGQKEIQNLWGKGPIFVGAYQSIAWFYAATTGQIAIKYGMKGPCGVVVQEGAGGLEALWHSRRNIIRGVDFVISGGTEAPIGPYALTCQLTNGRLSSASDPAKAFLPFDERANGYVFGEGGAIITVEDRGSAERREAPKLYGEIAGYGTTNDAFDAKQPTRDGGQLERAMRIALERADVAAEDVDAVFADAAGVPVADAAEAQAIKSVFDGRDVPVTAPKTMVGRLYAGGGALDVAAALLAIRDGVLPPTINLEQPAEGCDLAFVKDEAREAELDTVLVNARGFGGFNGALVLRRVT